MRRLVSLLAIMLAFTACNIGAEINIKEDGSGTFGVSMLLAKTDIAMLSSLPGAKGADPIAQMKKSLQSSSSLMKVEEFQQDGGRGIRGTIPFTSVAQLRTEMETMNQAPGGGPLGGNGTFKDFSLDKTPGGWHFESQQDAPTMPGVNASQGASAGGSAGEFGQFFENAIQLQFKVTLPGQATSTNANQTQTNGGSTTFIWIPDLKKPAAMHLVADTRIGSGGTFPVLPVGIGGGAALLAIIAGFVVANKRKASAAIASAQAEQTAEPIVPTAPSYTPEPPTEPPATETPTEPPAEPPVT